MGFYHAQRSLTQFEYAAANALKAHCFRPLSSAPLYQSLHYCIRQRAYAATRRIEASDFHRLLPSTALAPSPSPVALSCQSFIFCYHKNRINVSISHLRNARNLIGPLYQEYSGTTARNGESPVSYFEFGSLDSDDFFGVDGGDSNEAASESSKLQKSVDTSFFEQEGHDLSSDCLVNQMEGLKLGSNLGSVTQQVGSTDAYVAKESSHSKAEEAEQDRNKTFSDFEANLEARLKAYILEKSFDIQDQLRELERQIIDARIGAVLNERRMKEYVLDKVFDLEDELRQCEMFIPLKNSWLDSQRNTADRIVYPIESADTDEYSDSTGGIRVTRTAKYAMQSSLVGRKHLTFQPNSPLEAVRTAASTPPRHGRSNSTKPRPKYRLKAKFSS